MKVFRSESGQVLLELAVSLLILLLPLAAGVTNFGLELVDFSVRKELAHLVARDLSIAQRTRSDLEYSCEPTDFISLANQRFTQHAVRLGLDPNHYRINVQPVELDLASSGSLNPYPGVRVTISRTRRFSAFSGIAGPKTCAASIFPMLPRRHRGSLGNAKNNGADCTVPPMTPAESIVDDECASEG